MLVIARILWLGTHIFIMDSITEKNLPGCHQILQIWSGLSSSVTTRTVYQRREWAVAHKLLIFFAFLSFSAYFYLFTCSRTPNFFSVLHMLTPSLLLLLTPFFCIDFYREIGASQRCVFMNWLFFIIYQNWSILHNKLPQKILWAMYLIEKSGREGECTDDSNH